MEGNDVAKADPRGRPLTADEELLCACGHPELADEDPVRVARIAAELTAGFDALRGVVKAVSIFGSARAVLDSPEYATARAVAEALGRAGFAVITVVGPGVMEAANRGARDAGALSIGLTIELPHEQRANGYVDRAVHFRCFFARTVMFVRYAAALVALPGGFGTLDELFEALPHPDRQDHQLPRGSGRHRPLVRASRLAVRSAARSRPHRATGPRPLARDRRSRHGRRHRDPRPPGAARRPGHCRTGA